MTVHTNLTGYLERPYLDFAYLTEGQYGNDGMQAEFNIQDLPDETGMQALFSQAGVEKQTGMQTEFTIEDDVSFAMEFNADTLSHKQCLGYLVDPYLTTPYLVAQMCAHMGMQAEFAVIEPHEEGMQTEFQIVDADDDSFNGMQTTFVVEDDASFGMQMLIQTIDLTGMQFLATLYNTKNLRILCDFQSRGDATTTGGTNTWGNDSGVGRNWKVNVTTDSGPDHEIENLNTDIVEQTWKAESAKSGINLDCDTERAQGVFMDTFSIQNHNFTGGATVSLLGSNDSTFTVIGITRSLEVIDEPNIYHIEEDLPTTSYRYWRISIDDATNPDPIEIGTIVFGASKIFTGECIVDEIDLERRDFADKIQTEGFTNISNSRTQKKVVGLRFRSLDFTRGNYQTLTDIFLTRRTVLKCLWIPTPDPSDNEFMARFAVFSKISRIPRERHNNKGSKLDFASFQLELDESL